MKMMMKFLMVLGMIDYDDDEAFNGGGDQWWWWPDGHNGSGDGDNVVLSIGSAGDDEE